MKTANFILSGLLLAIGGAPVFADGARNISATQDAAAPAAQLASAAPAVAVAAADGGVKPRLKKSRRRKASAFAPADAPVTPAHDGNANQPQPHQPVVAVLETSAPMPEVQVKEGAGAHGEACNPPFKTEVAALFDRWNASLRSGDPKQVVANYAPDSVLLPTLSNRARFTAAEKEAYFLHFLQRRPEGRIDDRLIEVDCNSAVDTGLYTFRFMDGSSVQARYSFAYKRLQGKWLISSHHSSAMPETAAATDEPGSGSARSAASDAGSMARAWVRYP